MLDKDVNQHSIKINKNKCIGTTCCATCYHYATYCGEKKLSVFMHC